MFWCWSCGLQLLESMAIIIWTDLSDRPLWWRTLNKISCGEHEERLRSAKLATTWAWRLGSDKTSANLITVGTNSTGFLYQFTYKYVGVFFMIPKSQEPLWCVNRWGAEVKSSFVDPNQILSAFLLCVPLRCCGSPLSCPTTSVSFLWRWLKAKRQINR